MRNGLNVLLDLLYLLQALILDDDLCVRTHAEFVDQDILSLDCLKAFRKISEQVVIRFRMFVSPNRGNQSDHGKD